MRSRMTLAALVGEVFGDDLYFHGTQIFFSPVGGARRPYWHRDIQYMRRDEQEQARLLLEFCNLHIRLALRPDRYATSGLVSAGALCM